MISKIYFLEEAKAKSRTFSALNFQVLVLSENTFSFSITSS